MCSCSHLHACAPRWSFPSSGPVFTLGLGVSFSTFVSESSAFLSSHMLGAQLRRALSPGLAADVSFALHQNFSCLLVFSLKLHPG